MSDLGNTEMALLRTHGAHPIDRQIGNVGAPLLRRARQISNIFALLLDRNVGPNHKTVTVRRP